MKDLAIVLLTYASGIDSPRHEYAMRTVEALARHISYSGNIHWHIADDGSPAAHVVALRDRIRDKADIPFPVDLNQPMYPTITTSDRRGYGANYNLATQMLHTDCEYFLMIEDDWELAKELDLDPLVAALEEGIGCIRLGYLGWTQELRGKIIAKAGQTFLLLDPASEEPHVWSGHPRLESKEFQRTVGPWPEGLDPGSTEFVVSHRDASRYNVVWPLDLGIRAGQIQGTLFAHIGAVQAREDQVKV